MFLLYFFLRINRGFWKCLLRVDRWRFHWNNSTACPSEFLETFPKITLKLFPDVLILKYDRKQC